MKQLKNGNIPRIPNLFLPGIMPQRKGIGRRSSSSLTSNPRTQQPALEVQMQSGSVIFSRHKAQAIRWKRIRIRLSILGPLLLFSIAAYAQGTPLDTGFTNLQNLFTGTVAKVGSLIAILVGGYQFAHGEPGAKRALAGVAAGTGIAILAANVLTWLWG
jgi:type IV secretory pathway VirB2 component (pilin)